jgi:DNA-binding XRE family transcriptional regulator
MSIITAMADLEQEAEKRRDVLKTALAIARMNPDARENLASYLSALNAAQAAGDEDEQKYVIDAIIEIFAPDADGGSLQKWEGQTRLQPGGATAAEQIHREAENFFRAYRKLKEQSGLTIRQIAAAAGLSPTTIVAIEKQRVKPQTRTMQALAKAFGVTAEALSGQNARPARSPR